jgi:hypothetical protein
MAGMVSAFSTAAGTVACDIEDHAAQGQLAEVATLIEELNTFARQLPQALGDLSIDRLRRDAGNAGDGK